MTIYKISKIVEMGISLMNLFFFLGMVTIVSLVGIFQAVTLSKEIFFIMLFFGFSYVGTAVDHVSLVIQNKQK